MPLQFTLCADTLDGDDDIRQLKSDIIYNVRVAADEAQRYLNEFRVYDFIWLDDKHLRLQNFLRECRRNCNRTSHEGCNDDDEEGEDDDNKSESSTEERDPNLQIDLFQNQVRKQKQKFDQQELRPKIFKVFSGHDFFFVAICETIVYLVSILLFLSVKTADRRVVRHVRKV